MIFSSTDKKTSRQKQTNKRQPESAESERENPECEMIFLFKKKSVDERIGSPIFLITAGVFGAAAVGGGADADFPDLHLRLS